MKWLETTRLEFRKAVKDCKGVCVIPMGCSEAHGDHMPLGTDLILIEEMVSRAARKEQVVEFPAYYFTQIQEARHQPGTIAINARLMWDMLENICDEVSRNGFKKIVFVNGHGGNYYLLPYFSQMRLEKKHDYVLYLYRGGHWPAENVPDGKKIDMIADGHGGEQETSLMLSIKPELVKKKCIKPRKTKLDRMSHLKDMTTGFDWYSANPDHYTGCHTDRASQKEGEFLLKYAVSRLAKAFQIIKDDDVAPKVLKEFYDACL